MVLLNFGMHKNYKHRFWGEARFFSLFRPFFVTCKACVHAGRRLLGQALSKSMDVRFLVARNPTFKPAELDVFINDEVYFVRSGAVGNSSLSSDQIEVMIVDQSPVVFGKLARNAALSSMLENLCDPWIHGNFY